MRRGGVHGDDNGARIGRRDAKGGDVGRLAIGNRLGPGDLDRRIEVIALFRSGRRVQRAVDAVNEFLRHQRVAVGPFQPLAQMEGIGLAIGTRLPAFGGARDDLAHGIEGHQPLIDVGLNPARRRVEIHMRVK